MATEQTVTPAKVGDLMRTDVVTLKSSDTLGLADDIMALGRIRHLPVLSGARMVGIVSQRDLFRAAVSSVCSMRKATERAWLARIPVREVMTKRVVTIDPESSIRQAVQRMVKKRIGCLPVVAGDRLVGLLSETDCLLYLERLLELPEIKARLPELVD